MGIKMCGLGGHKRPCAAIGEAMLKLIERRKDVSHDVDDTSEDVVVNISHR
jgi:hypothetical protein